MYVDWSFPEKSEGIGRRRGGWGGGGMWQIPSMVGVRIFSSTSWPLEEQHAMHIFQVVIAVIL